MKLRRDVSEWSVEGGWYRLHGTIGGAVATLDDQAGRRWAELRMLASVDTVGQVDETFALAGPEMEEADGAVGLTWDLTGSAWAVKRLIVAATDATIAVRVEVRGTGDVATVSILGGRVVQPRATGVLRSGAWFRSVVSAAPADPARIVRSAAESSVIGVVSGSEPGRGRWFFTPAPFVFAAAYEAAGDAARLPDGPWLTFALDAVSGAAGFTELGYRAIDHGFLFDLDYDGHTTIDGTWTSPSLVIGTATTPFGGIAAQRDRIAARPDRAWTGDRPRPDWWREPIFCGWGAQSALAARAGLPMSAAAGYATQAHYDAFLEHLAARRITPGTVMVDDKWQSSYGTNDPDPAKWPDLRGWIASRRAAGQRVLLWYKAWDPEGLPAEWCVRSSAGTPIAIDPTNPAAEAAIRRSVRTMLGADGLDADGLKIDFTARTPSGHATTSHGTAWGVDLLARLLDVIADEARGIKSEALLVGHTPNPIVAPAVDMIRLNDALRLDDPEPARDIVAQMRYRAAVVRAACPEHLIDTDDWCAPDLAAWRAYAAIKPELGVPALYYVTHIDRTGEPLEDRDYDLIRRTWAEYRRAADLPRRGATAANG